MKRVRNRKLVRQDDSVEWILARTATVGGIEQQLGYCCAFTARDYLFARDACALKLWVCRRKLRDYIASVVNT